MEIRTNILKTDSNSGNILALLAENGIYASYDGETLLLTGRSTRHVNRQVDKVKRLLKENNVKAEFDHQVIPKWK